MSTGVRSGLLLAVLGVWLIMRATHQDAGGKTLINHIIDGGASPPSQTATGAAQIQAAGGVQLASPSADFTNNTAASIVPGVVSPTAGSAVTAAATVPNPRLADAQGQIASALASLHAHGH